MQFRCHSTTHAGSSRVDDVMEHMVTWMKCSIVFVWAECTWSTDKRKWVSFCNCSQWKTVGGTG